MPKENDGQFPWQDSETGEWRQDCPLSVVPGWVWEACRWYRLGKTPMDFGWASRLTGAFVEVMEEFEAAEAEEAARRADK